MTRLLVPMLALALSAAAQTDSPRPRTPITGEVLNAETGDPISGATVHYLGVGNTWDEQKHVLNPSTRQGEVRTAADGSYTLPILPSGDFHVRASASGFRSEDSNVNSGFARDFRLEPDPLQMQVMSSAALAAFALPSGGIANRDYRAAALTPDGNRFAFFTLDTYIPKVVGDVLPTPFQRCVAWTYNLKTGVLKATDQREESGACDSTAIAWDGEVFYTNAFPYDNPQTGSPPVAERIQDREAMVMPVSSLPKSVQEEFARKASETAAAQKLGLTDLTADGQFTVELELEGRSSCGPLVVIEIPSRRRRTIAPDECAGFSFILDGDRVFYRDDPNFEQSHSANITEFNLKTSARRVFSVPDHRDDAPQFIARQPLPGGALRVAFAIKGDCDPASTDYNEMSPEFDLGPTPNQSSVCFITVPPAQKPPPGPAQTYPTPAKGPAK